MFLQAALIQILFVAAIKDALQIAPLLRLLVNLQVLLEITAAGKLFGTVLAFEWFFSGVDSLVANQVADLAEGHGAPGMVALERLLLVVNPGMLLQGGILGECLVALVTTGLGMISRDLEYQIVPG